MIVVTAHTHPFAPDPWPLSKESVDQPAADEEACRSKEPPTADEAGEVAWCFEVSEDSDAWCS